MANAESVASFEHACRDAQVPSTRAAAELTLERLAAQPDIVTVALAVATQTNSPYARFHASTALRQAAVRQWHSLPFGLRVGRESLRNVLVQLVLSRPTLTPLERNSLLRTAATLARQAYLEESAADRSAFFDSVCAAAISPSLPSSAVAATEFLNVLLEEFTAPTLNASSTALHRELLVQTRATFMASTGHLVPLLHAATAVLNTILSQTSQASRGASEFDARALPALSAVFVVLSTDPAQSVLTTVEGAPDDAGDDAVADSHENVVINSFTGPDWAPVLEHIPHILRICLHFTRDHTHFPADGPELPDAVIKAANVITTIAAISHKCYRTPDESLSVLATLMDGVHEQDWASSWNGAIRLAHADMWLSVSCAYGLASLDRLGSAHIQAFTDNTCAEMDRAAVRNAFAGAEDDLYTMDVADVLLRTWANLALQGDDGCPGSEHRLADNIAEVMLYFTRMSLRTTGDNASYYVGVQQADTEEDFGFEDMSIADTRVSTAAILTRFVLPKMAPAIAHSLRISAETVFKWAEDHTSPPGQIPRITNSLTLDFYQEDLFFLIRLTVAVLADEAKGEHPSVPIQFLPHLAQDGTASGQRQSNPSPHVQVLLSALFEVSQMETALMERRSVHCDEASPRVGSAILLALSRVAKTYLVPVNIEGGTHSAAEVAIGLTMVANGRAGCLEKAIEGISKRGFEPDVAEAAATLLSTLAAGASRYPDVRNSPAWQTLLNAGAQAYQTLPAQAVRRIGRSLAIVLGDVVAEHLLLPAYNSLQSFAEAKVRSADAADRAIATLNLLRGAAQCEAMGPQTQQAILMSVRAPDGMAASCAKAFGGVRPDVARSLIKLVDDIVSSSMQLLSESDSRMLLTNIVTIVQMHADIVANFINSSSDVELATNVEDIIALLSRILDEEAEVDVGEACYYGLSTLLPIMSNSILSLPSVGSGFFRLTTRLVSHHPNKLALVPPDFCSKILHTIDLQRKSVEIGSERRGLEAIASLARARVMGGKDGPSSGVVDAALLGFLKSIFDGIASGSAHMSNLDAAADAILPLVHLKQDGHCSAFEQLGQALLTASGNNASMRAAVQHLAQAASEAGVVHGFHSDRGSQFNSVAERAARIQASKRFREAVGNFSNAARKCLLSIAIGGIAS